MGAETVDLLYPSDYIIINVRNVPQHWVEADIDKIFRVYGPLREISLLPSQGTG